MADIPLKIYFDVPENTLRDSDANPITTERLFPSATFGQKFWINVQATKNGVTTKYDELTLGSSAEVLVENDYLNASPIFGLPGDGGGYWEVSSGSEYYYTGDEVTVAPAKVYLDTTEATEGTLGALNVSEWAWDTINTRLVVRLADSTDPDIKADSWVTYKITVTGETKPFIYVDSDTFNQASSWYDTDTETYRNPVIEDGEISFYINANTSDFYDRLENKKWKVDTTLQIQFIAPITAQLYKMFEFNFVCNNLFIGVGFTLDIVGANVYTKAEVLAKFVQLSLSTAYPAAASVTAAMELFVREAGVSKYITITQMDQYLLNAGVNVPLPDSTETIVEIGATAAYRYFDIRFTIDDGSDYDAFGYVIKHDDVTPQWMKVGSFVPDISNVAITFDISGGQVRLKINNTSGGALKLVWGVMNKLIIST